MNFKWTTRAEKLLVVDYWWEQQRGLCCICSEIMEPYTRKHPSSRLSATIEHLIPRRENGPNTVGNVRLAHGICNHALGALFSINLEREKRRLPPLSAQWALENKRGPLHAKPGRRPQYTLSALKRMTAEENDRRMQSYLSTKEKAERDKPIRGTLAHAVAIGDVSPDLMYIRPKPMDVKLGPQQRRATAFETAQWLRIQGVRGA